jgi:N-acetylmuramoyl-L-alanine amidase
MKKAFEKTLGLFFCLTFLILTALPTAAAAKKTELTTKHVRDKNVNAHPSVQITYSGQSIAGGGLLINETTYIPLRAFVDTLTDAVITYDAKNREATVTDKGLTLLVRDGSHVIYANGRALYSLTPAVVMSDGKMYIPIRTAAKVMGVSVTWSDKTRSASLAGKVSYLISGDLYYNADSLYWLSRIISAESRGEPLLGQIAVGSVVLNRMRSPLYPATIYGVIFDRRYGVQFSPVSDGSIYQSPYEASVTAAKICLEGYSVSAEILFFLEPRISTSLWIPNNRSYRFTIGNHDFYA